ncbi:MAG: hypothetical protein JXD22_03340 [Sedimentisphaerales bacterium]|nr:hypothetical protein [Sedimentisphaerales bacterium]
MRCHLILITFCALIMATGCESPELIQCRQNAQSLQSQLDMSRKERVQEKKNSEQMIAALMEQSSEESQKIEALLEQARSEERSKYAEGLKEEREKLRQHTLALLEVQQNSKKMQQDYEALEAKIADYEKSLKNSAEMIQALSAENDKLEQEAQQLKAQIEALKNN